MKKISVKEAARILGVSPQFIRIGLQREKLKIGTAVFMGKRWSYYISPKLLSDYVGNTGCEKDYERRMCHEA